MDLDGTGVPSHRVEVRISDPETQCDRSKPGHLDRSWMTDMGSERNYLGLLDFGRMEAQGLLDIAGYEFVYQSHAVSFTDEFSTACEPPVLVFFDEADSIVDTVDPKGLSMTSIVKELAVRHLCLADFRSRECALTDCLSAHDCRYVVSKRASALLQNMGPLGICRKNST